MESEFCPIHLSDRSKSIILDVLKCIRSNFSEDFESLAYLVQSIESLPEQEANNGTRGEWRIKRSFNSPKDYQSAKGHGEAQGIIFLADDPYLDAGTIAHELGHAFTNIEELCEREGPSDEWRSEACADMHAVRWGFLTQEDIRRRHQENSIGDGTTSSWFHHGPAPGGPSIEIDGIWWELTENWVFQIAEHGNEIDC